MHQQPEQKQKRSLQDWLDWQETLHPAAIDLGLDRVSEVARCLGLLPPLSKTVTVGGTNGKGSTVLALETLLLHEGKTVGSYTSPHLLKYNERIRINGKAVDDDVLVDAFERIDLARQSTSLTYFEFGTLAALWIFRQSGVDFQLLEVGLGGRLDAVNIVDADVAVVTNVSLDHQSWLGSDREAIACEKIGIYRDHASCIFGESNPPAVFRDYRQNHERCFFADDDFGLKRVQGVSDQASGWCWSGRLPDSAEQTLQLPQLSLVAPSVACALQAMLVLGFVPKPGWSHALAGVGLPGRFQRLLARGRHFLLDVAHNEAAVVRLVSQLENLDHQPSSFHFVVSVLEDKDRAAMFDCFAETGFSGHWYLAPVDSPRSSKANELAALLEKSFLAQKRSGVDVKTFDTIAGALEAAIKASTDDAMIVVFGSFYTVTEALAFLGDESTNGQSYGKTA